MIRVKFGFPERGRGELAVFLQTTEGKKAAKEARVTVIEAVKMNIRFEIHWNNHDIVLAAPADIKQQGIDLIDKLKSYHDGVVWLTIINIPHPLTWDEAGQLASVFNGVVEVKQSIIGHPVESEQPALMIMILFKDADPLIIRLSRHDTGMSSVMSHLKKVGQEIMKRRMQQC